MYIPTGTWIRHMISMYALIWEVCVKIRIDLSNDLETTSRMYKEVSWHSDILDFKICNTTYMLMHSICIVFFNIFFGWLTFQVDLLHMLGYCLLKTSLYQLSCVVVVFSSIFLSPSRPWLCPRDLPFCLFYPSIDLWSMSFISVLSYQQFA